MYCSEYMNICLTNDAIVSFIDSRQISKDLTSFTLDSFYGTSDTKPFISKKIHHFKEKKQQQQNTVLLNIKTARL